ncbi:hypothetical protein BDV11DRAFT_175006 [Aspergillus similis]
MPSPISLGAFLDFLTLRRIWRRQTNPSSTDSDLQVIPNACYEPCNSAFLEGQSTGYTPALCAVGSRFSDLVDQCRQCIERFVNSSSSNSTASAASNRTTSDFNEFIAYCSEQGGNSGNGNNTDVAEVNNLAEINSLLASYSSLTSSESLLQVSLSSLGYTGDFPGSTSATATDDVTASTTSTLGSIATAGEGNRDISNEGRNGSVAENLASSGSSNVSVVAPAVIVPVVALFAGAVLAWALLRRRRKRRGMEGIGPTGDGFNDKAQLHADEFRPELDGLAVAKKKVVIMDEDLAELPAREPVGTEMNGFGRSELDGEGRESPVAAESR